MSFPAPTRTAHRAFCELEGWTLVANAVGKPVAHHVTYELPLLDGRVLRTRVSRPVNSDTYGRSLWSHILRDELDVGAAVFWECVQHSVRPPRPGAVSRPEGVPVALVMELRRRLGLSDDQISHLDRATAAALIASYWAEEGGA